MSPESPSEVKDALTVFGKKILDLTSELAKRIGPYYISYMRQTLEEPSYAEDGTISGGRYETEEVQIPNYWPIADKVCEKIKNSKESKSLIAILKTHFQMDEKKATRIANEFCRRLAFEILEGKSQSNIVKERVGLLINELKGLPVPWMMEIKFCGIVPRAESITIADGIILRKVKKEDLTFEYHPKIPPHPSPRFQHYDAIIEMNILAKVFREAQEEVERLTETLRLFKVGAVHYQSYKIHTKSIIQWGGGTMSTTRNLSGSPKYFLDKNDEQELREFYSIVKDLIKSEMIFSSPTKPLHMSLRRYKESLIDGVGEEVKLTTAVMGLEALYLETESELMHRLALRTSKFLSHLYEDPKIVLKNVKEAYRIRSKHLHGSTLNKKEHQKLPDLSNLIRGYLRKSILALLLIDTKKNMGKKKVIKLIDDALISNEDDRALQKLLLEATDVVGFAFEKR